QNAKDLKINRGIAKLMQFVWPTVSKQIEKTDSEFESLATLLGARYIVRLVGFKSFLWSLNPTSMAEVMVKGHEYGTAYPRGTNCITTADMPLPGYTKTDTSTFVLELQVQPCDAAPSTWESLIAVMPARDISK